MTVPRITIVTPSFNQGEFLEQTMLSVLLQDYPNLEYIVIDGGSTDGSVEIIRRHEHRLAYWESRKDAGQADAIVKGFGKATGEILGWLNSDDMLLPGALSGVGRHLPRECSCVAVGGGIVYIAGAGVLVKGGVPRRRSWRQMLWLGHGLFQPATFWTRDAYEKVGGLDKALHYCMDYDLFVRLSAAGEVVIIPEYLAAFRLHAKQKTYLIRETGQRERQDVRDRYGSGSLGGAYEFLRKVDIPQRLVSWLAWRRDRIEMEKYFGAWIERIEESRTVTRVQTAE
jgi:glycosyltransferase involved in cell wall biosynthesis